VVNVQQLHDAVEAGAKFIVSPSSDAEIIAEAIRLGVPITPGVVTPSEIMIGLKLGLKVFKFFPAENYGGLKTIKALSGPFPQIKILPTGGINQNNAAEYFKSPKILAVGGSWMCTKDMISSGDFDGIAEKAARVMEEKYPGLRIVGTGDGYFTDDGPVVEKINAAGPQLLLVCLGASKQEKWIKKNL
jgi:2-dehydro-3-deoxyphosphogluconate aldolase/(4S)-4-hydroxy-2-oxoglutarate aldolase